jgi:transcriptional regulator with XRE-family HTH domain
MTAVTVPELGQVGADIAAMRALVKRGRVPEWVASAALAAAVGEYDADQVTTAVTSAEHAPRLTGSTVSVESSAAGDDLAEWVSQPITDTQRRILGRRMAQARNQGGFTQDEAATTAVIPRSAVSAIENGVRRLLATELRDLAQLYDVSVDDLMAEPFIDFDQTEPLEHPLATWGERLHGALTEVFPDGVAQRITDCDALGALSTVLRTRCTASGATPCDVLRQLDVNDLDHAGRAEAPAAFLSNCIQRLPVESRCVPEESRCASCAQRPPTHGDVCCQCYEPDQR